MNNNLEALKLFLLKDRKLINVKDSFERTLLHYIMLASGDVFSIVEHLLNNRADLNSKDIDGFTPIYYACKNDKKKIVKYLLERGAEPPGITNRKYNKLFMQHKFKDFHQPRVDLTMTDSETNEIVKELEETIDDQSLTSERLSTKKFLNDLANQADNKWISTYKKHKKDNNVEDSPSGKHSETQRLPQNLRKSLYANYEFDQEEDSDMRSTVITEETAKNYYNDEIANLKILVHVLNEKLESTNYDYSLVQKELRSLKETALQISNLQTENNDLLKENSLLQDKIDELLSSIEAALDKIDELSKQIEEKDTQLDRDRELDKVIKDYKLRIKLLEDELQKTKLELERFKQQSGKMMQELADKLKQQEEEAGMFSVDYFVIGRFVRIIDKETLSHFRVRLKNQDSKDTGNLPYKKVKKVMTDLKVTPQDLPNLMRLAGFYEEDDPSDLINIGKEILFY
jgi:DNA repair exonuclease SbcCD ATPase subunit